MKQERIGMEQFRFDKGCSIKNDEAEQNLVVVAPAGIVFIKKSAHAAG